MSNRSTKQSADDVMANSFAQHMTPEESNLPVELQARMAFMQGGAAQQIAHVQTAPKDKKAPSDNGSKKKREAKGKRKGKRTGAKIAPEDTSGGGGGGGAGSNATMRVELIRALQEHQIKVGIFCFLCTSAGIGVALVEAGQKNIGGVILWVAVLCLVLSIVFLFFKAVVECCMLGPAEHCCFNRGIFGCCSARRPTTDLSAKAKMAVGDQQK
jgi:hypothetical protein